MIDFLNEFFSVIKLYVQFLFSLPIVEGVSVGSFLLVCLCLWCITTVLWVRKKII